MGKIGYPADDIEARPILDPGEYHVRINKAEVIQGEAGKRDRLTFQMVVASGTNAGFPVFAGYSLPSEDDKDTVCAWEAEQGLGDKARKMSGFLLSLIKPAADACGVSWGKSGFDPDNFMGKECRINIKHRDYEGEIQMDVKGWKKLSG